MIEDLGCDARPRVVDSDRDPRTVPGGSDDHFTPALAGVDGVGQEVQNDLVDLGRIANDRRQVCEIEVDLNVEKDWINANGSDAVSITSTGAVNNVDFDAVAGPDGDNPVTETDVDPTTHTVYAGETLTFTETFDTGDPAAYDTLLRLRKDVRSGNNVRLTTAIDSLEALTREYPAYADAYAELATAYIIHSNRGGLIPEQFEDKALAAAQQAVRLGPDVATGHIALANVLTGRGEFLQAAPVIERALELEPGNADLMADQAAVLAASTL